MLPWYGSESNNWPRYLLFMISDQNMMSSIFKNLNISGMKRDI